MLLLIDNFDSFTFNLAHSFEALGIPVHTLRSSLADLDTCLTLSPNALVIGPGPGAPHQAKMSNNLILKFAGKIPILGICLGHQCIGELFGGKVVKAKKPMHGKVSPIYHDGRTIFSDLSQGFLATRYHSLIVERSSLSDCLSISAETADGEIMGLRHLDLSIESVQFHPESCMTDEGQIIFTNFLKNYNIRIPT